MAHEVPVRLTLERAKKLVSDTVARRIVLEAEMEDIDELFSVIASIHYREWSGRKYFHKPEYMWTDNDGMIRFRTQLREDHEEFTIHPDAFAEAFTTLSRNQEMKRREHADSAGTR